MRKILLLLVILVFTATGLVFAGGTGVTIRYEGNNTYSGTAQVEIINGDGQRVIVNLFDPAKLSAPVTQADVLLISGNDYYTADFIRDFPGEKLVARVGEIGREGLHIRGISSNRDDKTEFPDENGSNYIFLIEMEGIRIADFGYIGQGKLTSEQLKALGAIDIALLPFYNFRNGMSVYDPRGYRLMDQVKPKLIIPTGLDLDTALLAKEKWPTSYWDEPLTINQNQLPVKTRVVFMGPEAKQYGKSCKASKGPGFNL